jgi:hypothetical protein
MTERPALVRIEQQSDGKEARVVITLGWHEHEYLGEALGSPEEAARPRLLGEATLRAVEALSAERIDLALEAIATTYLGDSRVAMAQVEMGKSDSLVGSAMLREDDPAAAPVRAVLDAINRRLELVL